MSDPVSIPWRAQPGPQLIATQHCWVDEMLYGGARGGGKTSWLLGDFAQDVPTAAGPHWHGILFRKTYGQLEEVIKQSLEMYPRWFDPYQDGRCVWMAGEKTWKWKNGATLKLRYIESEDDWTQYHGHQYTWIGWDELTTWATPDLYMKLKGTLRSSSPLVKHKRIRASANPGGVGHTWVKKYFGIDRFPEGSKLLMDPDSSMSRMFIKARVQDNKILMAADPGYVKRLNAVGSKELVKAWLEGDWDIVQGAYFDEFSKDRHVIKPFEVPMHWPRIRMMDWGSSSPFAVLWAAVSDGSRLDDGREYPKGSLIVYREWYGAMSTPSGKWIGIKMRNEDIGHGILARERACDERPDDSVADPAMFAQDGGMSIAEAIARATDGEVMFRRGDNKRLAGWAQIRDRLIGDANGPRLYFFDTCEHIIRTLPALTHDETKAEDVNTDGEDHAPDALRYGCMSRPWVRDPPEPKAPVVVGYRLDDLWKDHEAARRWRR